MADSKRWTVRGIRPETLILLSNIRQTSGGTYGEFINESVEWWYDSLPDADSDEEDDQAA